MTDTPLPETSADRAETLGDLRVEIDRIDAAMHENLIARGEIIDRLIAVKARAGGGSAFRPDREASMMRHIAERHRGRLPLDTVEGIWRIIISTFTYVQAAYAVHADASAGDPAMRDSARFHFGYTVPLHVHESGAAVIAAVREAGTDLGLVRLHGGAAAGPWWRLLVGTDAPKVIARLPFVERPDHPAGMPVLVVAMPSAATPATEVLLMSLWVDRWRDGIAGAVAALGGEILEQAAADDGLALLVTVPGADPGAEPAEAAAARLRDTLGAVAADVRVACIGSHAARYDFAPALPA
jgi:chorismate mutase